MNETEVRKESTIKDFLEVIFRRKWIIAGIVVIATIVVVFINVRDPAVYESSAKVFVKRGEQPGVFSRSVPTLSWEEEIASQIEMVKSKILVDRAQELFDDYAPPGYTTTQKISEGRVDAGVVSTSNVIWIAYSSRDPIFCEIATNAIVNAYKDYYQRIRTPPEMEDFFSQEMQALSDEIDYWRERKKRVTREWGIVDLEKQKSETLRGRERHQRELEDVNQELAEKQAIVHYLDELRESGGEGLPAVTTGLLSSTISGSAVERTRIELSRLRVKESELAVGYTGEHRKLKEVRKQIAELEKVLEREIDAMLSVNRTQMEVVQSRRRYLRDMVAQYEEESKTYPEKEVELEQVNIALNRVMESYKKLVEKHMESKLTLASNPEWTVTILNPASPGYRKKTRDYVRMALGPIFSLVIALGFAFFVDNLDHSIKNVTEAEESLNLQVLASFPERHGK